MNDKPVPAQNGTAPSAPPSARADDPQNMAYDSEIYEYEPGQAWLYPTPEGFEDSRIIIGAIEPVQDSEPLICVTISNAPVPQPDGRIAKATIPFMPFTQTALDATILRMDKVSGVAEEFQAPYEAWCEDPEGKGFFNISFPALLAQLYKEYTGAEEN